MLDQVILVDEADQPIGVMDKVEAHRGLAHLHRASSVFLFNDQGELLLQQRSAEKIVGAGQWANTCCGNLRPGESYEACAYRRLEEELGISEVELIPVHKFQYFTPCNADFSEREMDQVFVGYYSGAIQPNAREVSDYTWKNLGQLRLELNAQPERYAPWLQLMMNDDYLLAKLPN